MQLPATLTLREARATLEAAQAALAQFGGGTFAVDAAALDEFDTSAIAVLLDLRRSVQARGLAFEISNPPPKLLQLAELYGVAGLLVRAPAQAG